MIVFLDVSKLAYPFCDKNFAQGWRNVLKTEGARASRYQIKEKINMIFRFQLQKTGGARAPFAPLPLGVFPSKVVMPYIDGP